MATLEFTSLDAIASPLDEERTCSMCGGPHEHVGNLGRLSWYRCQSCGWQEAWDAYDNTPD